MKMEIIMIRKIILLPVLTLALALSSIGFAHAKESGGCMCAGKKIMKKWQEKLDLTDAQVKQIKAIKEESWSKLKANYEQMKSLRKEMHTLATSGKMDQNKVNELVNQKKELIGENTKIKLDTKNKIYNLLNDQQKQKFSAMMEKWQQKRMERMKKMMEDKNGDDDDDDDNDD